MKREEMDYPEQPRIRLSTEMMKRLVVMAEDRDKERAKKGHTENKDSGVSGLIREILSERLGVVDSGKPAPVRGKPAVKAQTAADPATEVRRLLDEVKAETKHLNEDVIPFFKPGEAPYEEALGKVRSAKAAWTEAKKRAEATQGKLP